MLDVVVCGECSKDQVLGLTLKALTEFAVQVVAAHSTLREAYVLHIREVATQVCQHRGFPRYATEEQMLETTANDRMEDRISAAGDEVYLDYVALCPFAIILRELAERAFWLAAVCKEPAFDHIFRIGRHSNLAVQAFDNRQRCAG